MVTFLLIMTKNHGTDKLGDLNMGWFWSIQQDRKGMGGIKVESIRHRGGRRHVESRVREGPWNEGFYLTILPGAACLVPQPRSPFRLPIKLPTRDEDLQNQTRCSSIPELSPQAFHNSLTLSTILMAVPQPNPQKILNFPLYTVQNYTKLSGKQAQIPLLLFHLLLWNCIESPWVLFVAW